MQFFGSSQTSVAALVTLLLFGPAMAETTADCGSIYKAYVDRLKGSVVSSERWIALHRAALRAYDACETGDLHDAEGVFERLDRNRY
jgi:hypothetical protein